MDGLLDFPFHIYRLFIKNLDSFAVDLVVGLRLVFLEKRLGEHQKQTTSAIREHQSQANHEIDCEGVKILDKESV